MRSRFPSRAKGLSLRKTKRTFAPSTCPVFNWARISVRAHSQKWESRSIVSQTNKWLLRSLTRAKSKLKQTERDCDVKLKFLGKCGIPTSPNCTKFSRIKSTCTWCLSTPAMVNFSITLCNRKDSVSWRAANSWCNWLTQYSICMNWESRTEISNLKICSLTTNSTSRWQILGSVMSVLRGRC